MRSRLQFPVWHYRMCRILCSICFSTPKCSNLVEYVTRWVDLNQKFFFLEHRNCDLQKNFFSRQNFFSNKNGASFFSPWNIRKAWTKDETLVYSEKDPKLRPKMRLKKSRNRVLIHRYTRRVSRVKLGYVRQCQIHVYIYKYLNGLFQKSITKFAGWIDRNFSQSKSHGVFVSSSIKKKRQNND